MMSSCQVDDHLTLKDHFPFFQFIQLSTVNSGVQCRHSSDKLIPVGSVPELSLGKYGAGVIRDVGRLRGVLHSELLLHE